MLSTVLGIAILLGVGALIGLIPYALGRYMNKPEMGKLGLVCCTLSGMLFLEVFTAIGFVIALLVKKDDYHRRGAYAPPPPQPGPRYGRPTTPVNMGNLVITCISGPLRGRTYRVSGSMLLGLNPECGVRFPEGTPGVSHRHCTVSWDAGANGLVLTDMGSSYGTFLSDGRKLPPQYPTSLQVGGRFYLATTACVFQVVAC